jgi:hypothetical protein
VNAGPGEQTRSPFASGQWLRSTLLMGGGDLVSRFWRNTGVRVAHPESRIGGRRCLFRFCVVVLVLQLCYAALLWTGPASARVTLPTRTCPSSQSATLPPNRPASFVAGPVTFFTFLNPRTLTSKTFAPRAPGSRLYKQFKVLVVLAPGTRATVSVPPSASAVLSLAYQPTLKPGAWFPLSAGQQAVRFIACEGQSNDPTGYGGGLLIAGNRCVALDVVAGAFHQRVRIPFAVPRC